MRSGAWFNLKMPVMEIRSLIDALTALYRQILKQEQQASEIASWVHPDYRQSALNLYHYLVLRSSDLRDLHDPLSDLGVSSLRSAEGYVLRNLHDVVRNLNCIAGTPWEEPATAIARSSCGNKPPACSDGPRRSSERKSWSPSPPPWPKTLIYWPIWPRAA